MRSSDLFLGVMDGLTAAARRTDGELMPRARSSTVSPWWTGHWLLAQGSPALGTSPCSGHIPEAHTRGLSEALGLDFTVI